MPHTLFYEQQRQLLMHEQAMIQMLLINLEPEPELEPELEPEPEPAQYQEPEQYQETYQELAQFQEQYDKDCTTFEKIKQMIITYDISYLKVDPFIMRTIIMNNNGIISVENVSTNDTGYVRIIYINTTDDIINIDQYECSMTYFHTLPEIELALSLIET
jgi:hypothetical protein